MHVTPTHYPGAPITLHYCAWHTHQRLGDLERLASVAMRLAAVVVEEVLVLVRVHLADTDCHARLSSDWTIPIVGGVAVCGRDEAHGHRTRCVRSVACGTRMRGYANDVLHEASPIFGKPERRRSVRIVHNYGTLRRLLRSSIGCHTAPTRSRDSVRHTVRDAVNEQVARTPVYAPSAPVALIERLDDMTVCVG